MTDHLAYEAKFSPPSDAGSFEGLASVFDQKDLIGDVVAPGAFRRTLQEHKAANRMPPMLWGHDRNEPIGRWLDIRETSKGLQVKGQLTLDVQRAREARALLLDGAVSGLSFSFNTKVAERRGSGRLIKDVDLYECSLVSMPCAPNARVSSVKSTSNGGRRSIPPKDPLMSDDTDHDGAVETAAAELPPEVIERIEAIETKAAQADELATRLDKIETRLARPNARVEVRENQTQLEVKAFTTWCRKGWDGLGDIERKVLAAGGVGSPAGEGWQLVPETFLRELLKNLVEISPMRQIARVQQVSGTPVLLPKRVANLSAGWVAETAQHAVSEPTYAQQSVPIFECRVSVEVTNQLLEDAAFNLASELSADFAEEFGRLEAEAFVSGNGTTEPEGFLTSPAFTTSAGGAALDADDVIGLYYAIPDRYAANGTWVMRRETIADVRKLRSDPTGPYIWVDSIAPGTPASLLGRPVVEMPDMSTVGSPAGTTIAFGDWSRAYRVFDRVGLEVLRDPYSLARNSIVCFHARRRVGGALVDGAAVKGLSL